MVIYFPVAVLTIISCLYNLQSTPIQTPPFEVRCEPVDKQIGGIPDFGVVAVSTYAVGVIGTVTVGLRV
jgi:hypothetical protein